VHVDILAVPVIFLYEKAALGSFLDALGSM
jgi:hypothetical protein